MYSIWQDISSKHILKWQPLHHSQTAIVFIYFFYIFYFKPREISKDFK